MPIYSPDLPDPEWYRHDKIQGEKQIRFIFVAEHTFLLLNAIVLKNPNAVFSRFFPWHRPCFDSL
jgi:hypothetical protein